MKNIISLLLVFIVTISCSSDSGSNDQNNNPNIHPGAITSIIFENSSFTGTALVKYTDNSTYEGSFINGKMEIPNSGTGKTIANIQPQNQPYILIGRKEGFPINLNYNNGVLVHRAPVSGYVPIGTYAEFQLINTNTTTLNANYQLEADLDLMHILWTPIGTNTSFKGIFFGGNHEINNLKITSSEQYTGLFGICEQGDISFLTIRSGSVSNTGNYVGSIVGGIFNGNIIGCKNYATVQGNTQQDSASGGIAGIGSESNFGECENYGNVSGRNVAGITSAANNLADCRNYGSIQITGGGSSSNFGAGIVGRALDVTNCLNMGEITIVTNNQFLGSIGGIATEIYSSISGSFNKGNIIVQGSGAGSIGSIGGVVGYVHISTINNTIPILACYNAGNISGKNCVIGGIVGNAGKGDIRNCYNTGNLTNNPGNANYSSATGGIVGIIDRPGAVLISAYINISQCYNTGQVNGVANIDGTFRNGGIVGAAIVNALGYNLTVYDCYWSDNLSDNTLYGAGIISNGGAITSNVDTGSSKFGATLWPSAAQNWIVGDPMSGSYWKSLGSWNNGNPIYPKLYFED